MTNQKTYQQRQAIIIILYWLQRQFVLNQLLGILLFCNRNCQILICATSSCGKSHMAIGVVLDFSHFFMFEIVQKRAGNVNAKHGCMQGCNGNGTWTHDRDVTEMDISEIGNFCLRK